MQRRYIHPIGIIQSSFCQELSLKLDDKRSKSFESFRQFLTAKIQDLEGIKGKLVDDDNKWIRLTNTLSSQAHIDAAISQAITTELTINGTHGSSTTIYVYYKILSIATLMDSI
jgi:hypothetical protein